MNQTLGEFIEVFPPEYDSLELRFTPTSGRIKHRWRHQRLSAHFIADYFINFLPFNQNNPAEEQRLKETNGAISYISNELIENAMKFNVESSRYQVELGVHFIDGPDLLAVMYATNTTDITGAEKFLTFIQTLLASDPEEFYVQQVEASAEDEEAEISGLGFLTMVNDYQAKLGWKFETLQMDPELISVTTMAQIRI